MVDETTQETPEVKADANTEADAPEQKASEENQNEEGLLGKEEEPKENAPIPDGLDAEIFDAETRTLKEDKVDELCEKYPAIFWNLVGKCVDRSVEIGQDETKEAVTLLIRGYNEGNKPTSSSS